MSNFDLQYRPLLLSTSILNGRVNEPGTLGLFASDAVGAAWLISCYHVLCDGGLAAYRQDDSIYQPAAAAPQFAIAKTDASRINVDLDCAAAKVNSGIAVKSWIPGIGPITQASVATVDLRVMKVGAMGGVTEGVITQITGDSIMIRTNPDFPQDYFISQAGDSGALWIDQATRAPIALHRGLRNPRTATATAIGAVLKALNLTAL